MTKVIVGEDCGNSPKNLFLVKLTTAFAKSDVDYILSNVTEDIRWNIVGDQLIEGKDDFAEALKRLKASKLEQVTIQHTVTHGKAGAVDGVTKSKNGLIYAFCDVYEFGNTKGTNVKEITSFVVAT
jgi:hypothetical protein